MCRKRPIKHWCEEGKHERPLTSPMYEVTQYCHRACPTESMTLTGDTKWEKYTCSICRQAETEARLLRDRERSRCRDSEDDRGEPPTEAWTPL